VVYFTCTWQIDEVRSVMIDDSRVYIEQHIQLFYGCLDFVQDNPGEPVPDETFTHTHCGHQSSLSAFSIYYDPWHTPYSIHVLYSPFPPSLSKFSLVYLLVWAELSTTLSTMCPLYVTLVQYFIAINEGNHRSQQHYYLSFIQQICSMN